MAGAQIGGSTIVGGASSVLAGGNFWDGARQGFITAALNHVAHGAVSVIRKTRLSRQLTKASYNIDDVATMSHEYIKEMIQKVAILEKQYRRAGSPDIDSWVLGGEKEGTYGAVKYNFTSNVIESVNFYNIAFSSNFQLASTLGHEMVHIQDIYNGNYRKWFAESGEYFRNRTIRANQVQFRSEMNAYGWEIRFGDYNYAQTQFEHYSKLTKIK